ncbi:MAG: hypothetical protein AB1796_14715 [Bacillota bacterium]
MDEDARQICHVMNELFSSFNGTKNELIPILQRPGEVRAPAGETRREGGGILISI